MEARGLAMEKTATGMRMKFDINSSNPVDLLKEPMLISEKPKPYVLPSLDLLRELSIKSGKEKSSDVKKMAAEKARILDRTFKNFKVGATVTNVYVGPAVTKFEVNPHEGGKSK